MYFLNSELLNNVELQKEADQAKKDIGTLVSVSQRSLTDINMGLVSYLLYRVSSYNDPMSFSFEKLLSTDFNLGPDSEFHISRSLTDTEWKMLLELTTKYTPDVFAKATLDYCERHSRRGSAIIEETPASIVRLAQKILSVEPQDKVADLCCGCGTFLFESALEEPDAYYYGCEINPESKLIATIKSNLVNDDIEIDLQDAFNLLDDTPRKSFDKIFSNYPFRLPVRNLGNGTKLIQKMIEKSPDLSRLTSSDWVFNALLCELISDTGKAIGIMTNGSTWNGTDMAIRRHFIENGLVESVIALPERMFVSTSIATSLIVLSKGNTSVRVVDATKICHQGRRYNEFDTEDINTILHALQENGPESKSLSIEELRENEYTLHFGRYLTRDEFEFANARPFGEVIKSITRGASCTANQLDELASDKKTDAQYLMLSNIQNGVIDDQLPFLSHIDSKLEKYCLKNNELILSKNGYPYKAAVATVRDGQKILANGNLYIIELNEEEADPYYIKAFFESEKGVALLKSISVGATIPNIGIDSLKKVQIPIPPMEQQKEVRAQYQATLDEIAIYKLKIEKAYSRLQHIFDEDSEG